MKKYVLTFQVFFLCLIYSSCRQFENHNEENVKKSKDVFLTNKEFKLKEMTIEELSKEYPYDFFDTILSNGYNLRFRYYKDHDTNPIDMCLMLINKNRIIDTLNILSAGLPHKNLGYIGADFNEYFAFLQSYGSGNPHEMQLIKKSDATEIIRGFFVDADQKNELLLYCKGYDSLMIYDINRKTDKLLVSLNECDYITCMVSQLCGNLKIKKVTQKQVEIEIAQDENKTIRKMYYR